MTDQKTIESYRHNAIMSALGAALALADPDNPDCRVGSIHDDGSDDRHIREAVSSYVHSWIAEPLAAALGVGSLEGFEFGGRESVTAQSYLKELRAALTKPGILDDSQLTLDQIQSMAKRPTEHASHREVTIATTCYQSMPLPTDGNINSLSMGGDYRYLFHREGAVDVEYINGLGVLRETFFGGQRIARSYTPTDASA